MHDSLFTARQFHVLLAILIPVYVTAQTDINPVVIQYGDTEMERREFELEFEMIMVLKAVESSVPVKSQNQINLMQQRYLEQRAKEMVLSDLAAQRGIALSDADLDRILDEYMMSLGFSGYSIKNMQKLGFTDETGIRNYLQRRELIKRLLSEMMADLETADTRAAVESRIDTLYIDSGIRIFPENLQRPVSE